MPQVDSPETSHLPNASVYDGSQTVAPVREEEESDDDDGTNGSHDSEINNIDIQRDGNTDRADAGKHGESAQGADTNSQGVRSRKAPKGGS